MYPWETASRRNNRKKPFRPRCKRCKSNKGVIPIVYGFEAKEELLRMEKANLVVYGGVARSVDSPNWRCTKCGEEFLR